MHIDNKFWSGQKLSLEIGNSRYSLRFGRPSVSWKTLRKIEGWILAGVLLMGIFLLVGPRSSQPVYNPLKLSKSLSWCRHDHRLRFPVLQLGIGYRLMTMIFLFTFGSHAYRAYASQNH